jgi:hypothetical protein
MQPNGAWTALTALRGVPQPARARAHVGNAPALAVPTTLCGAGQVARVAGNLRVVAVRQTRLGRDDLLISLARFSALSG